MKGAISISLYGYAAKYSVGAIENAKLAKIIYPGWTLIFHVEQGHPTIPQLRTLGAEIVEHPKEVGSGGMFWRFYTIDDKRFTHTIVRDADSRINVREKEAVYAWIDSDRTLHVMEDNPWHKKRKIIGGSWGCKNNLSMSFTQASLEWPHHTNYGDDENFLEQVVWPKLSHNNDFIKHSYSPEVDAIHFPDHEHYSGFICEQVKPTFTDNFEAYVLSPEKYKTRRSKFFKSLESYGGFLKDKVVWWKGSEMKDRFIPDHFDHSKTYPHYYLATRDHCDILEQAILKGVDYLFVFEDDVSFIPDFEEYFLRAYSAVPANWKAIVLGGQPQTNDKRFHISPAAPEMIAQVRGTLGMHGTFWNRAGMIRALNHFTYWNRQTIDQAFGGLQRQENDYYAPARWVVEIDPEAAQFGKDR